jgi:hypothetical protein
LALRISSEICLIDLISFRSRSMGIIIGLLSIL